MKHIVSGVLAHVDAGKTTLSENLLYLGGSIRKMGRVDKGDSFFDTDSIERQRGITIFSKQGSFSYGDTEFTLLDTPGHVDFSAEMERTLQVLDYAILLVSAADGVTAHTRTLFKLLNRYQIPAFIFVNKMDQPGADSQVLFKDLKDNLSVQVVDFSEYGEKFYEDIAANSEILLEKFLNSENICDSDIAKEIKNRHIFPVFFGSALKGNGIKELMDALDRFCINPEYGDDFSAVIYKISRDNDGNRLTHMKITGGVLKSKDVLSDFGKVNQIRIYRGTKFDIAESVKAGRICTVTGLSNTGCTMVIGNGTPLVPLLAPVLKYSVITKNKSDMTVILPRLKELEEEIPELLISYNEELKEIHAELMGEVQIEIIKQLVLDRYGMEIEFGTGRILYRETISSSAYGVGHFEPLRHYAEVHLILEPGERGSGLSFESECPEEVLAKNWQRLILTHLEEKIHKGVLTGAPVTDIKIKLASGRAHNKHTEGGDFRQATYRAVRNGLMYAQSVLLEPYYDFLIEIPDENLGRAMMDIEKYHGKMKSMEIEGAKAFLKGYGPVSLFCGYQKEITAYTKGQGKISLEFHGYEECHNPEEVIAECGYNPENDIRNTPDSVFCANGAGYIVPWYEVRDKMHMPSVVKTKDTTEDTAIYQRTKNNGPLDISLGTEEIDEIIHRAGNSNSGVSANKWNRKKGNLHEARIVTYKNRPAKEKYMLVDGYNVIFAWKELKELAAVNIDSSRGRLLDILCNYQAIKGISIIVVFDAYRVQNHITEKLDYHNIHVIFTKEAETADCYIEQFAHENAGKYDITVVTSDGLEQIIIRGEGCNLISSREFEEEVKRASEANMAMYEALKSSEKTMK